MQALWWDGDLTQEPAGGLFFRWGMPTEYIHPKQPFTVPTYSVVAKP